jgi:pilus assembly protein FimV
MAGAELKMPSQAMVQSVPKQEAKEIAQSADAAYRSGKSDLPLSALPSSKDKTTTAVGDRLKVGPAAGLEGEAKRRMEELLVQEKALSEAKQRIVELEKNIADLKKLMQSQGSGQTKSEVIDWKNQTGPLAITVFVFLAILVLLKLSKSEAKKVAQSDSSPAKPNAVPEQAAKLFASLNLDLVPGTQNSGTKTAETTLPSVEALRVKLNLIRAYITIEDFVAARAAIHEVLAVSNQIDPELTIQAKSLMAEVNQLSSK